MPDRTLEILIELENQKAQKDLDSFNKALGTNEKNLNKTSSAFKNFVKVISVTAIAMAGKQLIDLASDAEEVENKFQVVFSTISEESEKVANDLAKNYGLSSKASKELLSDTGDLLSGFGFSQKATLEFSKQVNKLAVDLASFTNYSGGAAGASQALTKALLGERESIKALGIAITEADLKRLADEKGIEVLDRQTKAALTLELALKQSKNAIGDFARSQDSFANQSRVAQARMEDLFVILGQQILPAVTDVTGKIIDFTEGLMGNEDAMNGINAIFKVAGRSVKIFASLVLGAVSIIGEFAEILGLAGSEVDILERNFNKQSKAINEQIEEIDSLASTYETLKGKQNLTNEETIELQKTTEDLNKIIKQSSKDFNAEKVSVEEAAEAIRKLKVEKQQVLLLDLNKSRGVIVKQLTAEENKLKDLETRYQKAQKLANKYQDEFHSENAELALKAIETQEEELKVLETQLKDVENQSTKLMQTLSNTFAGVEPPKIEAPESEVDLIEEAQKNAKAQTKAWEKEWQTQNEVKRSYADIRGIIGREAAQAEIENEKLITEAKKEEEEERLQAVKEFYDTSVSIAKMSADTIGNIFTQLTDNEIVLTQNKAKKEQEQLEKDQEKQKKHLIETIVDEKKLKEALKDLDEEYNDKKEKSEKEFAKKESKLKQKKFEQDKTAAIIKTIIDTATATVEALPNVPLSIAVGAAGAINTALIASQPTPAFAMGGKFTTKGEQNIKVGDNAGGMERVTVEPISSFGDNETGGTLTPIIIQINEKPIYEGLLRATKNRVALIDRGSLV